ncbi:hypothetical protein M1O52_03220, partial [Dehalococcoidia bacterium]|nr:hypothetical protein [Dehalococcoidia bacterium]
MKEVQMVPLCLFSVVGFGVLSHYTKQVTRTQQQGTKFCLSRIGPLLANNDGPGHFPCHRADQCMR